MGEIVGWLGVLAGVIVTSWALGMEVKNHLIIAAIATGIGVAGLVVVVFA